MTKRIFVAGHRGMVGSSLVRQLSTDPNNELVTRTREELDLTNQAGVAALFEQEKIDEVYLGAAKVGGIYANNTYPAEFIYDNLMVECNVVHQAWKAGVQKLLFLGSSCIYPRLANQPIKETELMQGPLEPTNEAYALAKIAGIKLCKSYDRQYGTDYLSVMPTNLCGPHDNYHPDGAPRKLMDNSKLRSLGWEPRYTLREGLEDAYRWYADNLDTARGRPSE
jgi:GDP-L-fucose synthase